MGFLLTALFEGGGALLHLLLHPLQVQEIGDVDTELAIFAVQVQPAVEISLGLVELGAPGQKQIKTRGLNLLITTEASKDEIAPRMQESL